MLETRRRGLTKLTVGKYKEEKLLLEHFFHFEGGKDLKLQNVAARRVHRMLHVTRDSSWWARVISRDRLLPSFLSLRKLWGNPHHLRGRRLCVCRLLALRDGSNIEPEPREFPQVPGHVRCHHDRGLPRPVFCELWEHSPHSTDISTE